MLNVYQGSRGFDLVDCTMALEVYVFSYKGVVVYALN